MQSISNKKFHPYKVNFNIINIALQCVCEDGKTYDSQVLIMKSICLRNYGDGFAGNIFSVV